MLVLDVQGFQTDGNTFIVKELAFEWLSKDRREVLIFDPPCHWAQLPAKYEATNGWLLRNFHGLPWESFGNPYQDLANIIEKEVATAKVIFVKGLQKQSWLKKYTDKMVINLEDFGCPRSHAIENIVRCYVHERSSLISYYACAFENCQKLASWFRKYFPIAVREASKQSLYWFYQMDRWISEGNELQCLEEFLIGFGFHSIDELWEKLPAKLKDLETLNQYRRCHDHHITSSEGDT